MIMTIQYLHKRKDGYKHETMHLAGNIADRYLAYLSSKGKKAPNLSALATIALLMAAKIEQPISPSFTLSFALVLAHLCINLLLLRSIRVLLHRKNERNL